MNEKAKASKKMWKRILTGIFTVVLGYIVGLLTMVDFYHAGILTVLVFYFFRKKNWLCYFGQAFCLWYINIELLGGLGYEFSLFGETHFFLRQGLALLALIPIWLYRGKQGYHNKGLQYACYCFYPLHLLILGVLKIM